MPAPPHDPATVVAPPPPTPPPTPAADRRSRTPLVVAAGVVVLVALVVAAVALWPDGGDGEAGGDDPSPPTTEAPAPTGIDGRPLALLPAPGGPPEARWEVPFPCADGCRGAGSEDLAVLASATGEVVALDPGADDATSAVLWEATLEGTTGVPSVVLTGSLAVVEVPISEETHRLVALDAVSGTPRWEVDVPGLAGGGVVGDPHAATLVVLGSDPDDTTPDGLDRGSTHVVDPTTGALLWSTPGHPVGTTDDLVAVSDGATITLHDRRSGTERWSSEVATGPLVAAQPLPRGVLADDRLVVASEGEAVGLDPADGRQWRTPLPAGTAPDPSTGVVAAAEAEGGAVVLVGGPGGIVALDPSDGSSLWDVADGDPIVGDGALLAWVATRGSLVVGRDDGTLTARDLADGRATASATIEGVEEWLLLDGLVVARTEGAVVAHDAGTLDEAWRQEGRVEAVVAAPHGYLAATGDAVVRHEGPA